jgi:hypothetical protein
MEASKFGEGCDGKIDGAFGAIDEGNPEFCEFSHLEP